MDQGYDYKKFVVLTVDDEPQALKYFDKAFAKDFRILTAPSAERAMALFQEKGDQIAVLVTDQRMPGQTGVDLLGQVRKKWPDTVRIITTAYSELDSAIEAVNQGGVFRYIAKPWDIREFRGTLLRAMEFFLVQRERNLLLREKLSVLQRMIILDRVRSFTVLAASIAFRVRYSMTALKAFFDFVPVTVRDQSNDDSVNWNDLWSMAQTESQRILQAIDEVLTTTVESDYTFTNTVNIEKLIHQSLQTLAPELERRGLNIESHLPTGLPPLKADAKMIERLLGILLGRVASSAQEGQHLTIQAKDQQIVDGAPGIQLTISCNGPQWGTEQLASLFSSLRPTGNPDGHSGTDILSAFFIAHHHGGNLLVHTSGPKGPGFELLLPFDPEATVRPPVETDWLDRIFINLEGW